MAQIQELPIIESEFEEASISDLVQQVIEKAVRDRASDIHLEPYQEKFLVRARIDGRLTN